MVGTVLLVIHIGFGSAALIAALVALVTAKGRINHVRSGRVYATSMTAVFLTALPLAILGANIFLLFIATFSFYMVFAGWRFARNRRGRPHLVDLAAVTAMWLTGLGMWGYAIIMASVGDSQWVTLTLFGFIALALGTADAFFYRAQPAPYSRRISRHLTNMMAGTIATVTAVLVVNVETNPVWIAWVVATLAITPLIAWWNIRVVRKGR